MLNPIHGLIEPLLRLLWPPTGRRRAARSTRLACPSLSPTVPPRPRRAPDPVLRGEDSPLVRPYLVAHERLEEARLRRTTRARRRALWCAVHGIDIGPRLIHGVAVTA